MESLKPMIEAKIKELEETAQKYKEEAKQCQKLAAKAEQEASALRGIFAANNIVPSTSTLVQPEQDEEERAKAHYVIFTGPNKGIYDSWHKATIFITGYNVVHKKYSSLHEAKRALDEHNKKYSEVLKSPSLEKKKEIPVLGKIIKQPTISLIQSRKEKEAKTAMTRGRFKEQLNFLLSYKDEDKQFNIYPIGTKYSGPKAVILPEADPVQTYMLFQAGLVNSIYFNGLEIFEHFPPKFKQALRVYQEHILKNRGGFIKSFSTYPAFQGGGESEEEQDENQVQQQAVQVIQIGVSNGNYPVIEEEIGFTTVMEHFLNNYVSICIQLSKIKGRVNYSSKSILIWSKQTKSMIQGDEEILTSFLNELNTVSLPYPEDIKQKICERLSTEFPQDHICENCDTKASIGRISDEENGLNQK